MAPTLSNFIAFVKAHTRDGHKQLDVAGFHMFLEAGEVGNEIWKWRHKDGGVMTEERYDKLREEMGDLLHMFILVMNDAKMDLTDLMFANMNKVEARHGRIETEAASDEEVSGLRSGDPIRVPLRALL